MLQWLVPFYVLGLVLCGSLTESQELAHRIVGPTGFTRPHLDQLKNRTRSLFDHGWDSYMEYAYPADEVRPLTCQKYEKSNDIKDIYRNDVLGNYSVTFLDTITTFAVFNDRQNFEKYLWMLRDLSFDVDSTVQVFETSIRALGSLLSLHLYASDKYHIPNYDGFLLRLAQDLGNRLLFAYNTTSGIPVARVNLRDGARKLPSDLVEETCTAGAASPMLEMTLLSILTNETIYEEASRMAFFKLWNSRSKLDLVPMSVSPLEDKWLDAITGVGASIDSFYEYALKGSILFDDDELYTVWSKAYKALSTHSRVSSFLANVHCESGIHVSPWIDALSAFFPGLLVLAGKVEDAITFHQPFIKLWNKYNGIPERWNFVMGVQPGWAAEDEDPITLEWYPLRPEFIESTYYLYRATKDPVYLRVGEAVLRDYERLFRAPCGFAGFRDVRTREMQDRMESFVLSETFMYLYLLFDEDNDLNKDDEFIFSTEGHPLWLPKGALNQYKEHKKQLDIATLVAETRSGDVEEAQFSTVSSIIEKIKFWPEFDIASTAGYIKSLFDDHERSKKSVDTDSISKKVLERLWLQSFGYDLAPMDSGVCPVSGAVVPHDSLFSPYMGDSKAFMLDAMFQLHFRDSKMDLEVTDDFYDVFSPPHAYCERQPETDVVDFRFGDMVHNAVNTGVDYLVPLDTSAKPGESDLWLHQLNGLRVVFEILRPGEIDSSNNLVDEDFVTGFYERMEEYEVDGACPVVDEEQLLVFKAKVINGVTVGPDVTVFVSPANLGRDLMAQKVVRMTRDYNLVVNGNVVANMKLWPVKP